MKELVALLGTSQSYVSARSQGRFVHCSVGDARVRDLIRLGRSNLTDNLEHVCSCSRIEEEKR